MLLGGIVLGLVAGLIAGGRIGNIADVRLRWMTAIFFAVVLRFGTETALAHDVPLAETLRIPLLCAAYSILLASIYVNRQQPGMAMAFVGIASNAIVIAANGGRMPVWAPSLQATGLAPSDILTSIQLLLPGALDASFLVHLGPLADVIPIPVVPIQNVASVGDVLISFGLGFFLFATVVREPADVTDRRPYAADRPIPVGGLAGAARLQSTLGSRTAGYRGIRPETGLVASLADATLLTHPILLGGSVPGMAGPTGSIEAGPGARAGSAHAGSGLAGSGLADSGQAGSLTARARRHPYIRLSLNPSYSAIWTSSLVSLFGDRIHQVALALIVFSVTHSPIAVGFVFLSATLPNLVLGPISGTLVDRWDQKQVLVVCDLLRASIVMLIPIAVLANVVLAFPLVFLVTAVSLFFRPAREAAIPRLVGDDELLAANSANWLTETLADIVGYPLAGLFVGFLGSALPLAFWFDAATYLASAMLIITISLPPARPDGSEPLAVMTELKAGLRFLRHETVLLANTLQAMAANMTHGVVLAVAIVYVEQALQKGSLSTATVYAFLESGIGVGNLIGGVIIGVIGGKLAKGRLIIAGYAVEGACVVGLGLTGNVAVAIGLMVGSGIANMIYIIPSQTLFQQRTPRDMIGRVVGTRFSLVFGTLTLAMGVSGFLATVFGPAMVLTLFGAVTLVAGLGGLLVPSLRDS